MDLDNQYLDEVMKTRFYDLIKRKDIDLTKVSIKKKAYNEDFYKFNILVSELKEAYNLPIFEIALYLYKDYFDTMTEVMCCFDENNTWMLREEAAQQYHLDSVKNTLDSFLFM